MTYEPHYEGSSVVMGQPGAVCSAHGTHTYEARIGHHLPPRKLSSGQSTFQALGRGFTLFAFGAGECDGAALEQAAASLKLAQSSTPRWQSHGIRVDVYQMTSLMSADMSTRFDTPWSSYIPNWPAAVYLEGYTEHISNKYHEMDLYLSDVLLTQTAEQYAVTPPALTYASTTATITWRDVLTTWL